MTSSEVALRKRRSGINFLSLSTKTLFTRSPLNSGNSAMDVTRKKKDKFMPQETRDSPYDVTLLVEDGKEFKAHRKVLSEASPFFEKLLNSGMMESNEGVIRLEMLTEAGLGDVLEFVYTGGVETLAEDNARDLIEMADYLLILQLKTFAGRVLTQMLNTSNCISTYHFAERYQCEELISDAKMFVDAHFINPEKAKTFWNMSSEEVKNWISSGEIDISAEEDVFKIIITWIYHNESERRKYFADLFCQVRLVYVSRDYLSKYIVTNILVNNYEFCLELVMDALKAIDSKNSENISFPPPRKSLETPVILVSRWNDRQLLSYAPSTNTWYEVRDTPSVLSQMVSCHGTLYIFKQYVDRKLFCYDSFFDQWTDVPYKGKRDLRQIFVSDNNENRIYALESDKESCPDCELRSRNPQGASVRCGKQHLSYITKYKPESNSWEDILAFDFGLRKEVCLVAKDNFIYFIGGRIIGTGEYLADVDRYDLWKGQWDKLANLQEGRFKASGTTAYGKIFISGGYKNPNQENREYCVKSCEVYNERTNEWQLIASPRWSISPYRGSVSTMRVDDKVYMVDGSWLKGEDRGKIQCYDPDKDKWNVITQIPESTNGRGFSSTSCSITVFRGCKLHWQKTSSDSEDSEESDNQVT